MSDERSRLAKARRVIVKVGSQALSENPNLIAELARQVAALTNADRAFLLVSSGAVALGWEAMGFKERPKDAPRLRASAAAGQSLLMARYAEAFGRYDMRVAQVLMTHYDLSKRERLNNVRSALGELIAAGMVPIVNENDTVSTPEFRFSDNDQLTAMVAPLVSADLAILLTNVAGVLDATGETISVFHEDLSVHEHLGLPGEEGSGGIAAKVAASRQVCQWGAYAVVARAGEQDVLTRVLTGEDIGTLFLPYENALRARKHWIAYTLRPRGTLVVDPGAERALRRAQNSLLPIGVLGVRGRFDPGDSVRIVGTEGKEFARGLSRFSASEVSRIASICKDSTAFVDERAERAWVVVHKDDLVLLSGADPTNL